VEFNLETVLALLGAVVGGAILALKVIAPRTKTTADDKALEILEAARPYLPAKGDGTKAAPVDAVSREQVRDHRDGVKAVGFDPKAK